MINEFIEAPKKTKAIINDIANELYEEAVKNEDKFSMISMRDGLLGVSYVKHIKASIENDQQLHEDANSYLELIFQKLNDGYSSGHLYVEIMSLGKYMLICQENHWIQDVEESLESIDEVCEEIVKDLIEKRDFDPVMGVIAYGFYYLKRVKINAKFLMEIEKIIDFLDDISETDENGDLYWISKLFDDDRVYLGITHGVAGVLAFLTHCHELDLSEAYMEKIERLLIGGANFIESKYDNTQMQLFPIRMEEDGLNHVYPKHYCYGDFSTILSLIYTYTALKKDEKLKRAIGYLSETNKKGYAKPYLIAGCSLLYGHAGIAMIFKKVYQMTGIKEFEQYYFERLDYLLTKYDPCDKFLGFKGFWNQEIEHTNYSFNEGMIGIAMELWALVDEKNNFNHNEILFL